MGATQACAHKLYHQPAARQTQKSKSPGLYSSEGRRAQQRRMGREVKAAGGISCLPFQQGSQVADLRVLGNLQDEGHARPVIHTRSSARGHPHHPHMAIHTQPSTHSHPHMAVHTRPAGRVVATRMLRMLCVKRPPWP
uniref:Uncharacterized protein n=1 Tax=Chlamydomonas euryale TaxID=1486919 RepID=A0A7R9VMJ2_9CHLO